MEESVSAALAFGDVQVLAVAGKNAALEARLQAMRPGSGSRLFVFGFVSTIAELMAVSDVAITKSGGLTTSECLAMGLPMIVRDPIPGQEERNCDFVLEAGAGVKAQGPDSLRYKVGALLSDRGRLSRMGQAARKAGRPGAADQIVAEVRWGFLDPPTPPERIHVFDV
jgi:processive 1,2-diacylglycerol beta-glucosyltransferase